MLYPNPIELDLPPDLSAPRVARVALAVLQASDEAQLLHLFHLQRVVDRDDQRVVGLRDRDNVVAIRHGGRNALHSMLCRDDGLRPLTRHFV